MQLIEQRTDHDCLICCFAMAIGWSYDDVLSKLAPLNVDVRIEGVKFDHEFMRRLGLDLTYSNGFPIGNAVNRVKMWETSAEAFTFQAWGRRAILGVPSLNFMGRSHAIYWHYDTLFDPSTKLKYTAFDQLKATEVVFFKEGGQGAIIGPV